MNAISLQARAVQAAVFSPRLQHAVRLLQLSSQDFVRALQDEAQTNPFLDIDEPPPQPSDDCGKDDDRIWVAESDAAAPGSSTLRASGDADGKHDPRGLLQDVCTPGNLRAYVQAQIGTLRLSARERLLAATVCEALDDDGYLRVSLDEIAAVLTASDTGRPALPSDHAPSRTELEQALNCVQSCDPVGVGARSVAECLGLQLEALPQSACRERAMSAVSNHMDLLASHNLTKLARALGVTLLEAQEAVQCIRRLNAHPGWQHSADVARAITPDVTVKKQRGAWSTKLNASALPRVRLNEAYVKLAEGQRSELNAETAGCLEQARWTVNNVSQRLSTILAIARAIVARQSMFLEYGPLAMKPLGLQDIANAVDVHPSTVSRTVRNKYVATPWGVFELRHFFSRGMEHSTGRSTAPTALKELLHEIIVAESVEAPLSDVELTRALADQGFSIARRTVTKYRQGLGVETVERRRSNWAQMT